MFHGLRKGQDLSVCLPSKRGGEGRRRGGGRKKKAVRGKMIDRRDIKQRKSGRTGRGARLAGGKSRMEGEEKSEDRGVSVWVRESRGSKERRWGGGVGEPLLGVLGCLMDEGVVGLVGALSPE